MDGMMRLCSLQECKGRRVYAGYENIDDFKKLGDRCHLGISLIVGKENASQVYEFVGGLKILV